MKPFLRFERDGAVVVLTMDDPALRNPLSGNTAVGEFVAACARIEADPDVRAVVITGADPAFSSGGSLDAMREDWRDRKRGVAVRAQLREGVQPLSLALHALQVPTIAAVNGAAIGGGLCLSLAADIRVAADGAYFRAAGINNGLTASELGLSYLLPRAIGSSRAFEMMLTGRDVDADEAERIGLVSRKVPADDLLPTCYEMAERIAAFSRPGTELTKRTLWSGLDASNLEGHMQAEGLGQLYVRLLTANFEEAVAARAEKRPAVFLDDK